jgi:PAS domain S-box-containing protein
MADLRTLCENPSFKNLVRGFLDSPDDTASRATLQRWFDLYQMHYGYEHVFLFNPIGRQLLGSPADIRLQCPVLEQRMDAVLISENPVLIDLHTHGFQEHLHFAFAAPVVEQGRPIAIVVFDIDARSYLFPLLKRWPTPSSTAETLIVRRDGDDVVFLNELRFMPDAALRLRIPLTRTDVPAVRAALGHTGVFEGIDYRGARVIADVRDVTGMPWKMVNRMDLDEVYAPLRARQRSLWLQGAFLSLTVGLCLALVWRQQRLGEARHRLRRQQRFSASIAALLGSEAATPSRQTLGDITEIAARSMAVRRASIWRYSEDKSRIVCLDLFDAALEDHSSGEVLRASDFSQYTACHQQGQVIAAEDVLQDPRTRDIPAQYYQNAGISSLLDAPVWQSGRLVALFSFEHVGEKRRWEPEEEQFALTLAAHIAGFLEGEERARAEAALQENERRLRELFDGSRDGLVSVDAHGRFLSANQAYCDLLGYSLDELRAMADFYGVTPEQWRDWERDEIWNKRLMRNGTTGVYEKEYIRKDGTIVPVELQSFTVTNAEGGIEYLWGIARDISERKRTESVLSVQAAIADVFLAVKDDALYDSVLHIVLKAMSSPLGIFGFIDEDGSLLVPTMARQVWDKCRVADKIYRFPRDTWGDGSWARALREGTVNVSNELSVMVPDGHVSIKRHVTVPIMQDRTAVGLLQAANKHSDYSQEEVLLLQQIADHIAPILNARLARDRFEKQLQQRNEELSRFSYAVSHDLRSPLVTIKTFMGYLEKDMEARDSCRICKDIAFMRGATDKMTRMLDELLVFTRIGRLDNPVVSVPLQAVVKEAMQAVAGRMSERGVKVKVTLEPLLLCGDRPRLVDMFQNLLDNAVKFMGDQPAPFIEIGFETIDGETEVFVRDNGMGIDSRYQARVFNLFEKIDPSFEGTGMGLALVKRVISEHGGTIRVESEGLGTGTCFRCTLPGKNDGNVQG